jgi:hypothetical protein
MGILASNDRSSETQIIYNLISFQVIGKRVDAFKERINA